VSKPADHADERVLHEVLGHDPIPRQEEGEPAGRRHVALVQICDLAAGALDGSSFGHKDAHIK
jgi:hypothetical protein